MNTYKLKLKDVAWIYHEIQYEHANILNQEEHIEKILPAQLRDDIARTAPDEFYNGSKCKNTNPTYPIEDPEQEVEVVLDEKRILHLILHQYLNKKLDENTRADMENIIIQQSRIATKKVVEALVSEEKTYDERVEEAKAKIREAHGPDIDVYSTREMEEAFEPISFSSPFIIVKRKSDNVKGSLQFQSDPKVYFKFIPDV